MIEIRGRTGKRTYLGTPEEKRLMEEFRQYESSIRKTETFKIEFKQSYFDYSKLLKPDQPPRLRINFGGAEPFHTDRMFGNWKPKEDTFVLMAYSHNPDDEFWCLIRTTGEIVPVSEKQREDYLRRKMEEEEQKARKLLFAKEVGDSLVKRALRWLI